MLIGLIMRIFALASIALLLIPISALAENDSAIMGPYKVDFDLGVPRSAYTTDIKEPIEHEDRGGNLSTIYTLDITNKTESSKTARIKLTYYDEPQPVPTADDLKSEILFWINTLILYVLNNPDDLESVTADTRQIDGTTGAVGSGRTQYNDIKIDNSYLAIYYPLFDAEHLKCEIMSSYSWDEGTEDLLETIHIEKVT